MENNISELNENNHGLEVTQSKLRERISELEFIVDEGQEQLDQGDEARKDLKAELAEANEKIIQLEQELFESKTNQNEILETLKALEEEMERVMLENQRMHHITKDARRAIYRAKQEDKVDSALGRVLNNYPERDCLKIMFLRESEGVYRFGSKRVYIKIEKGESVFVRVGGGFMHIDEFIDQFTPLELDKIERKDVSHKFSRKI